MVATLLDRLHLRSWRPKQTFLRQTSAIKSKKRPVWIYLWFCRNVLSRWGDAVRLGSDDAICWTSESEIISLYSMLFISPASHTRLLIAESCRSWNSSIENLATVSRCVSSDQNKYSQPKCDLLLNLSSSIFIPVSYSGWNKQGWSCKRLQNQNQNLVCMSLHRWLTSWIHWALWHQNILILAFVHSTRWVNNKTCLLINTVKFSLCLLTALRSGFMILMFMLLMLSWCPKAYT